MVSDSAESYFYVENLRSKPWHCRVNMGHEFKRTGKVVTYDVEIPGRPNPVTVYDFLTRCTLCGKPGRPESAWKKEQNESY